MTFVEMSHMFNGCEIQSLEKAVSESTVVVFSLAKFNAESTPVIMFSVVHSAIEDPANFCFVFISSTMALWTKVILYTDMNNQRVRVRSRKSTKTRYRKFKAGHLAHTENHTAHVT